MYEYIVCLCVSERESGVSEKSSGNHKPAGPVVINIWQLSGTCFMSTEARTFPFPNILLALMWRLN